MTIIASSYQLAETIAEITNLKVLEIYRSQCHTYGEAREIDIHLVDLCKRIVKVLEEEAVLPDPDKFEEWLLEKRLAEKTGQRQEDEPEPVIEPDPEENTRAVSAESDAELMTQRSQEPIGGGDLDTSKESNESPTTEKPVSEPKKTRVDNVSGSPVSGGDPDTSNIKRDPIAEQLEAWLLAEGLTPYSAGNVIGISGQSIANILNGTSAHPSKKSLKKIRTAIRKTTKPKKQVADPAPVKTNGTRNLGPAQFLQMKLTAWMEAEHIGISEAAGRLMVQESALRSIKAHLAVHPNIVRQLCRHIPSIEAERAMLIAAAEQQEAA